MARKNNNGEKGMDGVEKAAILLIALGPEKSAEIFKHLKEEEIEQLTLEIANTNSVSPQTKEQVLNEFYEVCLAQQYIAEGGIGYAKELLEKSLGEEKAKAVIGKLTASLQVRPFEFIRRTDSSQLLNFIQDEHPQTIALILSYLPPAQASAVISSLPPEKQADVARRIAQMDRTSPDVIKQVEKVLEKKLASLVNQDYTIVGGVDAIVEILNSVDRGTERHIMETLEVEEPELADEIRKKMFVFEDILSLDDRAIQRVLRDVDNSDLALALKGATEEVQNVILNNLSKRLAVMIKEDMEYMGPVRMKDVEEAQQKIVNIIRKLEDSAEIVIARGATFISEERIIDYNELIKLKLKNVVSVKESHSNVDADGFVNGLKADVVEQLLTGSEDENEAVDSQNPDDVKNQLAAAIEEANEQARSIKDEANEVLAQAHMEAGKIIEDAKRTGYEQGACNAREEYESKAEALEREYEQKKAQLEKEYNDLKAAIEPELVETITEVFRKITYTVAEDNKEIIIGLINGVMKNSDISNEFVIRVSPDDYRFLVNNQGKIYCAVSKEVNMDIVEDAAMKKNQCIIESDTGVYDCSLDIELNNLIRDIKLLSCTQ